MLQSPQPPLRRHYPWLAPMQAGPLVPQLMLLWRLNGHQAYSFCPLAQAGGSARRELLVLPLGHSARVAQRESETHPHPIAAPVLSYLWLTEERIAREAEASVLIR